jgi:mRNA interferase RelE/StbE
MNYSVQFSESALKEIRSLPKFEVPKIMTKIELLAVNPRPPGCKKLQATREPLWRIRLGNYRIVYSIDDGIKIVEIRTIGDRKDIYN